MKRFLRTVASIVASLVCGVLVWLGAAWVLSFVADRTSSEAAEVALAAISPLTFGPLVAAVAAALVFLVMRRHDRRQ